MPKSDALLSRKIANRARSHAMSELKKLHETEYWILYDTEAKKLREELGYRDLRPEANRLLKGKNA